MTHACINVFDTQGRNLLLHTHHSGYLLPEMINRVPAFIAERRFNFLFNKPKEYRTKKAMDKGLENLAFDDGLDSPPSIASVLIAMEPWMLEPVPPAFVDDLADWAGDDAAIRLLLHSTVKWEVIFDKRTIINPHKMMIDHLWKKWQ